MNNKLFYAVNLYRNKVSATGRLRHHCTGHGTPAQWWPLPRLKDQSGSPYRGGHQNQ